ncbi:Glycerophosphocholine phosphodiesterase gpcpd1, variant 2 [Dermatophagoides farinae]|nr:Glycerophosphocholine phosphodiesterase gpcpd1, variant 2 [Dermatophagoides farinae]
MKLNLVIMIVSIILPLIIVFGLASSTTITTAYNNDDNDVILQNKVAIQLRLYPGSSTIKLFNQNVDNNEHMNLTYKVFTQNLLDKKSTTTTTTTKYSRLIPDQSSYIRQPESGIVYNPKEFVSFWSNITTTDVSNTAFIIEIRINNNNDDEVQQNTVNGYIRPFDANETNGFRKIPLLNSSSQNVVGEIEVNYLIIRPTGDDFNPLSDHYISIDDIQVAGHRGTGTGIRYDLPEKFIENTISAFNYACKNGAQMIELDVQLSLDRIPVIYHDFEVQTNFVNRHKCKKHEMIKIPLKDFTLHSLQQISTNFMPHVSKNVSMFSQSFETLEQVLNYTDPNCGIDVEIKYPSQKKNLQYESELGVELNEYVDRILNILFKYGGERPMFITSFHADLCSMIRLKQNKYHVGFLTSAKHWSTDPRDFSIESAVAFAQSMMIKAIVPVVDPILTSKTTTNGRYKYIDYVKQRKLGLYLWGNKINSHQIVMNLLDNGVDLLIFDR